MEKDCLIMILTFLSVSRNPLRLCRVQRTFAERSFLIGRGTYLSKCTFRRIGPIDPQRIGHKLILVLRLLADEAVANFDYTQVMDARRLLQCAGIGASIVIGISGIVDVQASLGRSAVNAVSALQFLLLLGFAFAFWYNTRPAERLRRWLAIGLLILQLSVPLVGLPGELAFLVAAEIPFIIRGRKAFLWLAGLDVFLAGLALVAARAGDFGASDTVAHTHGTVAIALTVAMTVAWTLVAFSAGFLILEMEASRDATVWAKAQLESSQLLLTEDARLHERLRISRELHDTIGHHLTGLVVNLEVASELGSGSALGSIQRAQLIARLLLAEVREVVHSVGKDQPFDLKPALEQLAAAMKRPICRMEIDPDLALGAMETRALFRCAQETMTNAARHAQAAHMQVMIVRQGNRILFEAFDDGRGTAHVVAGYGLRGMQERFAELGGALEIESAPNRGFRLRGWIPASEA